MSKSALRTDKTCLNCRQVAAHRFCPNCGQENTDSRKTFHHLFIHFFEDLTHYENAFWRTIKNLLFKPSSLTTEYLSGKRLSYLAPVRLYIFISFLTFFMFTIIPDTANHLIKVKQAPATPASSAQNVKKNRGIPISKAAKEMSEKKKDSVRSGNSKDGGSFLNFGYTSMKELDSVKKYSPPSQAMSDFTYWINKKSIAVTQKNSKSQIIDKFRESFVHNFPKVLFIYMPIFAFFLWIFHGKKRWYYFDHGIFTLHYFSFLLSIVLILFLVDVALTALSNSTYILVINAIIQSAGLGWMFYYFFPAHHRFYGETRLVSFLKSAALFVINCILILILMAVFSIYTYINLH